MAVCLHTVYHPGMYLGWSGVTRESRDTWTRACLYRECYPVMYRGLSGVSMGMGVHTLSPSENLLGHSVVILSLRPCRL